MKTTLRYLLMMLVVTGVLSVSAQTPQYGKPYKPYSRSNHEVVQQQAQMPEATMSSTGSVMMETGSTLPQAAVTGTSTTYDNGGRPGKIRRVGENDGFEDEDDPDNPANPFPLGDGLWALMLLACAYLGMRVFLKRKRALKG